jgi:hypothetical protein
VGIVFGGEVPGEQFVDAVYRVLGDAGQDLAEIAFGIESIEFRRSDHRVDCGSSFAAGVRASAEESAIMAMNRGFFKLISFCTEPRIRSVYLSKHEILPNRG